MLRRSTPAALTVGLALALVTLSFPTLAKKQKKPEPVPPLSMSIAVAEENGQPVRDDAWIDAQVAESERLFRTCGVGFATPTRKKLDARFARLETRKDRDALAEQLEKGTINVMIVSSLRDVDDPSLHRMGVHWRPQ